MFMQAINRRGYEYGCIYVLPSLHSSMCVHSYLCVYIGEALLAVRKNVAPRDVCVFVQIIHLGYESVHVGLSFLLHSSIEYYLCVCVCVCVCICMLHR